MKSGYLYKFFSYCLSLATYKQGLARLLGVRVSEIERLYKEIREYEFMGEIRCKANLKDGFLNFGMSSVLRAPTLYVLCRVIKPQSVVETGVADGYSSSFILSALEANLKGHLYSIDLPNQPGQELTCGRTTGWLVPEGLKKRWTLLLGSSREKLPQLLDSLKTIDIFYHDSGHSYENMMFEFNEAISHLGQNSLLVSDDITDTKAFDDFCGISGLRYLKLFKLGLIKK